MRLKVLSLMTDNCTIAHWMKFPFPLWLKATLRAVVHTLMLAVCGGYRPIRICPLRSPGIHHMPDHLHAASLLINMPEDII